MTGQVVVREARSDADLATWTRIRNVVAANEPSTVEDLRRVLEREPERRILLAELSGEMVGCAFVAPSESMQGCAAAIPRVLRAARRHGVGSALLKACSARARELGAEALSSHVDADDEAAVGFASHYGFVEVDRQVELVRTLHGDEEPPVVPHGIEIEPLGPEQEAEIRAIAVEAASDMPVPGAVTSSVIDDWVEDVLSGVAAFAALDRGRMVGYAGLTALSARPGWAENTLTAVLRSHRRRGIASALKQSLVVWAAANGYQGLVTWTQEGNEGMQAVNERTGYRRGHVSVTLQGPLLP